MHRNWGGRGPGLLLFAVLAFSVVIRAKDLRWGTLGHPAFAYSQHSDEARKIEATLELRPTFEGLRPSPWLMIKGSLLPTLGRLLYEAFDRTPLARAFALTFGVPLGSTEGQYLFFRMVSAAASLVLTVIVFRLAVVLTGSGYAGVLAAFAFSTSFGAAFAAVTFKSDMLLATLVGALMLATAAYLERPVGVRAAALGAIWALAVAAKHSGGIAGVLPLVACAVAPGLRPPSRLQHLALCGVSALVTLFVAGPYYFLAPEVFLEGLRTAARYLSTPAYNFEGFGFRPVAVVTLLLVPGLGILLTGAGFLGLADLGRRFRDHLIHGPLLGFVVVYSAVVTWSSWLVLRYTLPLYPVFCAAAGAVTWRVVASCLARRTTMARLALAGLVLLGTLHTLRFFAFDRLLSEPSPIAQGTRWLKDNLPETAHVVEVCRRQPQFYGFREAPTQRLTARDVDELVERGVRLSAVADEYVVVTEENFRHFFRLRDVRYAGQRAFYAELFDVRRFRLVAKFETPTRVLGIPFPKGFLPEDLILVAPDTYVFRKVRGAADSGA